MSIKCTITTPEKLVYEGDAKLVVVPAVDGELGVLPGHAPLMALLGIGELRIQADNSTERFFVCGGFVQVIHNKVMVLATEADKSNEIDQQGAREALERILEEKPVGKPSIEEIETHNKDLRAAQMKVKIAAGV